jgi:hypothetical protein
MEWIECSNSKDLPRDGIIFLSLWKGRICMTQFDVEEGSFYIMFEPAGYSQAWRVDWERESKFTHWMPLPDLPKELYGMD